MMFYVYHYTFFAFPFSLFGTRSVSRICNLRVRLCFTLRFQGMLNKKQPRAFRDVRPPRTTPLRAIRLLSNTYVFMFHRPARRDRLRPRTPRFGNVECNHTCCMYPESILCARPGPGIHGGGHAISLAVRSIVTLNLSATHTHTGARATLCVTPAKAWDTRAPGWNAGSTNHLRRRGERLELARERAPGHLAQR